MTDAQDAGRVTEAMVEAARTEFGRWTIGVDRSAPRHEHYSVMRLRSGQAAEIVSRHALASEAEEARRQNEWPAALLAAEAVRPAALVSHETDIGDMQASSCGAGERQRPADDAGPEVERLRTEFNLPAEWPLLRIVRYAIEYTQETDRRSALANEYARKMQARADAFAREIEVLRAEAVRIRDETLEEAATIAERLPRVIGACVLSGVAMQQRIRAAIRALKAAALLSTKPRSVDTSAGCVDGADGSSASREEGLRHGG